MTRWTAKFWWLVQKDLISECRARQAWPAMLLVGSVVTLVFTIQIDLPAVDRQRIAGGLLWLAIFFAGTIALDRSFDCERQDGCLDALLSYPIPATLVYMAKFTVNVTALVCLECALIPLFVVLSDVPLLAHPVSLGFVAMLGNVGLAALGTLLSALISVARHRTSLLALLVLPLALPVLLGTAAATRLVMMGDFGAEWLRWVQLLGAFAITFLTAGVALFDFAIQE